MHVPFRGVVNAAIDIVTMVQHLNTTNHAPARVWEVAVKCGISESYVEQVISYLYKANITRGVRGPGGGYVIQKKEVTMADICKAFKAWSDSPRHTLNPVLEGKVNILHDAVMLNLSTIIVARASEVELFKPKAA